MGTRHLNWILDGTSFEVYDVLTELKSKVGFKE
jgi:hypothetical protein